MIHPTFSYPSSSGDRVLHIGQPSLTGMTIIWANTCTRHIDNRTDLRWAKGQNVVMRGVMDGHGIKLIPFQLS